MVYYSIYINVFVVWEKFLELLLLFAHYNVIRDSSDQYRELNLLMSVSPWNAFPAKSVFPAESIHAA